MSDPSFVKIVIAKAEYDRLVQIEKKYLELDKQNLKSSLDQGSTSSGITKTLQKNKDQVQIDQIGGGILTDLLKKLPELTFDFLLDKGIYALESATSSASGTQGTVKDQFTKFLSKAFIERFGIPPQLEEEGGNLIFY